LNDPSYPSGVALMMTAACDVQFCAAECLGNTIPVGGGGNVCPAVDDLTAMPLSASVGASVALTASANDPDLGPSALSYGFTLSTPQPGDGAGLIQNIDMASGTATFLCTSPGPVSIDVTVSDGDATCTGTNLSMQTFVICSP